MLKHSSQISGITTLGPEKNAKTCQSMRVRLNLTAAPVSKVKHTRRIRSRTLRPRFRRSKQPKLRRRNSKASMTRRLYLQRLTLCESNHGNRKTLMCNDLFVFSSVKDRFVYQKWAFTKYN